MMTIIKSIIYITSGINGADISKYDPCNNINNIELAIGCSTVNGRRVYRAGKLETIAKNSNEFYSVDN